jgi:hypothetical protein
MILPQTLLRYVPIANNARLPGRAIVLTYLALAVLTAVAVAERRTKRVGRVVGLFAIAIAVIVDYLPAPFPVSAMDRPALYDTLREHSAEGAVRELPLGLRDGFGVRGKFDDRVLFYQTIHRRPLVGGFVARLPRAVLDSYENDPLLAALLNLSEQPDPEDGEPTLPDRHIAGDRLRENRIAFIVLNRSTASPALIDYVDRVLPLTFIAREGERTLYRVAQ